MNRAGLAAVGPGLVAGAVAGALAGLALVGTPALSTGVFLVQVVIALAWLAALGTRGSLGAFAIGVGAAAAIDIVIGIASDPDIGDAAPILGIVVAVAMAHQLARRPRRAVTLSLAGTLSSVAFAVCAACYPALLAETSGDLASAAALLGVGVALAVARLCDLVAVTPSAFPGSRRGIVGVGVALAVARLCDLVAVTPSAFPGSRRGIVGVVVGAAVAAVVGAAYGSANSDLDTGVGTRVAVIAAVLALIADIAVDAVLTQAPPPDERRLSALTPLGVLLPVVLAGPVAYVTGRILLG